jgi:ankyrin repeat protein
VNEVGKVFGRAVMAAMALTMAVPASAQSYSDSFTFLKAVRERDGNKATALVSQPGTTVVNSRDSSGETALHIVTRGRDYTWLSFLLGRRGNANAQNNKGETPLSLAAQLGWIEGVELLLSQGATVDLANQRGETPLILAVHMHNLPMVRMLLANGASPTKTDHVAGYSALDYARQGSHDLPIARLLETKAKP